MAVVYVTGGEVGLSVPGGGGLALGTPSPNNSSLSQIRVKSGSYAYRVNHTASNIGVRAFVNIAAATANGGFWLYLETLPSADAKLFTIQGATNEDMVIQFDQGTGKLAGLDPVNGQIGIYTSCPVLSADTWYWIAWKSDRSANQLSITITPDGGSATDCGALTNAVGWTANNGWVAIGNDSADVAVDFYIDDIIVCSGTSEYPLNPHEVLLLQPGSDGTHNVAGTEYIASSTGTTPNFTNASTTVWQELDDLPWSTTLKTSGGVWCEVHSAGTYLEIAPATAASGKPDATAVRTILGYGSASTTANNGSAAVIRDSAGAETTIRGNFTTGADYSESSTFFNGAMVPAPAGGWTKTEIEALRWRIGRASNSSDISPRPSWQVLGLEIAYPIAAGTTVTGASSTALTVSYTTSARRAPRGVSTFPLNVSYTTSGRRIVTGASTYPLTITFTTTITGPQTLFGASTFPLTIAYTTRGIRAPRGASTFPLAISYTTSGRRTTKSASTFPLAISYTTQAKRTVHGASTYPLVISYSSRPASPTGASTFPLTMGFTSVGKVTRFGVSVRPLTVSFTTVGRATYKGASSFPLTVGYSSSGVRTGTGAALLPLVFLISSQWRAAVVPGDINVGDGGDMNVLLVDSRSVEELVVNNEVPRVSITETGDSDVAVTLSDT